MPLKATSGVAAQAGAMRRARDLKERQGPGGSRAGCSHPVPMVIRIPARAGSETGPSCSGSITTADVVEAVAEQARVTLDRRRLHLDEPIKTLGTHEVPVKLHSDVEFRVTVDVVRQ